MNELTKKQREEQEREEKRRAQLAADVEQDFQKRRDERRAIENCWQLNMQFYAGNQYCDVAPFGAVVEEEKRFYWQTRRVFNHIAPMVEARISKLEKMKPELRVRAFSDEDGDVKAAKLATGVLRYAQERISLSEHISKALNWSEICGSVFYKVAWDERGGRQVAVDENGLPIYEGEVKVAIVPPFEIFPDRLDIGGLDEATSIIHAQAVSANYVLERFGVSVQGTQVRALAVGTENGGVADVKMDDGVILLERYTRPCSAYPNGRLEIVAGGKLLYEGELPYENGERGERSFPFVKQDCLRVPGSFFGKCVVDRMIPVQRAYNAVRNRKHEFLNRLSMGVLTVEDGSVDTDELAEDGLLPGKILVYRQGGKAPEMLDCGNVPSEFKDEEEWLEKEFSLIGGISDLSQNSTPLRVTSATGLQLLLSQDESRMTATITEMERAVKEVGRHILRMYRQFAGSARLMTMTGENKRVELCYFNAEGLSVSDVQFESQEPSSPEEKKAVLLELYQAGLLTDDDGKMSKENKNRILEAFGFGSYENARDISALHIAKAGEENFTLKTQDVAPDCYDDHGLHISEHTRYLLSAEFKKSTKKEEIKARFIAHMDAHKAMEK